jgi:hypothetical protein
VFDILSFLVKPSDDHDPEVLTLTPAIDDVPLTELIEHFERERGMEPVGGYGGLVPSFFCYGPLDRYFLGRSEGEFFKKKSEYYLLGCQCGEVGCWPLSARITATEDSVVWDRFAQEHRRERDYSAFGPFTFELPAYKKTIEEISSRFRDLG